MGQEDQRVKILKVSEKTCPKWGKYYSADIMYVSENDMICMVTSMNTIECERYLHELDF